MKPPRQLQQEWLDALTDPARDSLTTAGVQLPEQVMQFAEPVRGEPAVDPHRINRLAAEIVLPGDAHFDHPMLERVVRVGLAHITATFRGDHPRYGVGTYEQEIHDGFPPTIIATVDALSLWGLIERAEQFFGYWLSNFVRDDGLISYYGPSLSEYGQLLTTARRLMDRGVAEEWLRRHQDSLNRLASYLQELLHGCENEQLAQGAPEADECNQPATYFHNNAWIVRGLEDWATVLEQSSSVTKTADSLRRDALQLRKLLINTVNNVWPDDAQDWWLRPMVEQESKGYWARPEGRITANRLGSYTNYRYWPELLSSGALPRELMLRIVNARLQGGGQYCGTTRFFDHLDDWPLMEYMEGLLQLGMFRDFRLCLWGHICYHQAEGHLTAYEQVSLPPGCKMADYCLPCQLVAVRAIGRARELRVGLL